jgi:hypothetical protein
MRKLTSKMSSEEEKLIEYKPSIYDEIHHIWKDKIDYGMQKGLFFGIRNFIGKVCLQTKMYEAHKHPAQQESKIMKLICSSRQPQRKHQRFLPTLVAHKSISVTAPLLYRLPMRSFGTSIHPRCDVIIVPKYDATLSELRERNILNLEDYRSIIFQILYTLFILQRKYGFMHNDLHIQNILMKKVPGQPRVDGKSRDYKVDEYTFQVPEIEWIPIMWDFEDSRCHKVPELMENLKTDNVPDVPPDWCPYYDVHFLLISIIDVCKESVPEEIRDWVFAMYPEEAIPARARRNSMVPSLHERRMQLAQYESKNLISQLLRGQSLPDAIHEQLAVYWNEIWSDDNSTMQSMDDDDDDSEEEDLERHYGQDDNYYDYLKSELPRDGIAWDEEVHDLCIQAKEDVTMSEDEPLLNNRLTNSFPNRDQLPTVKQLLASDFFQPFLKPSTT